MGSQYAPEGDQTFFGSPRVLRNRRCWVKRYENLQISRVPNRRASLFSDEDENALWKRKAAFAEIQDDLVEEAKYMISN